MIKGNITLRSFSQIILSFRFFLGIVIFLTCVIEPLIPQREGSSSDKLYSFHILTWRFLARKVSPKVGV